MWRKRGSVVAEIAVCLMLGPMVFCMTEHQYCDLKMLRLVSEWISPDSTALCIDYISLRPGRFYCRILDRYSGLLHLEPIFHRQPLDDTG